MIQATDELARNDQKPAPFYATYFQRHCRALPAELHIRQLEQDKEAFSTYASLLDTMIQQTKIIAHLIISRFVSTMHPFYYDARERRKKREAKAEMCERRLLLKIERHFSPGKNSSFNKGALGENALKESPRRRSLRNKIDKTFVQVVEVLNLCDLKVASPLYKRTRRERLIRHIKIITRNAKKSLDGSHSQHQNKTSAVIHLGNPEATTKMTDKAKTTPGDTAQSPDPKSRHIIDSGFEDYLSGKLPPSYSKPAMSIDDVFCRKYSIVLNARAFGSLGRISGTSR